MVKLFKRADKLTQEQSKSLRRKIALGSYIESVQKLVDEDRCPSCGIRGPMEPKMHQTHCLQFRCLECNYVRSYTWGDGKDEEWQKFIATLNIGDKNEH